ncbi:MAG TPA: DUF222 domain-containing protein [Acidimicrobiales bacterium]|nr:DUF222 domain-containing protein [Acidimicrobiales bacterium]
MSVAVLDVPESPRSATLQGRELIDGLRHIDTCLAEWLKQLDEFDTWGTWAEDGHTSCVAWLVDRCGLRRATAHEKLRVAKQLAKRKVLANALASGEVSYSKIRIATRIDDGNEELDRSLLDAAQAGTARDMEQLVRHWKLQHQQEKPPQNLYEKRGLYRQAGFGGGLDRIIIELTGDDAERFMNVIDTYLDWLYRQREKSPVETAGDESPVETAGDESPVETAGHESPVETPVGESPVETPEPALRPGVRAQRVDALLDLLEHAAYEHHDQIDVERAAVGVTVDYDTLVNATPGGADLSSGATITGDAARRLACDAGVHRIVVKGTSEILDVGQKTRTWTVAQRRSIAARHGHRCAYSGCERRIYQIHHIVLWENGGATAVYNGVPLCLAHHHLVHEGGWTVSYDPTTGTTSFTGSDGQQATSRNRLRRVA